MRRPSAGPEAPRCPHQGPLVVMRAPVVRANRRFGALAGDADDPRDGAGWSGAGGRWGKTPASRSSRTSAQTARSRASTARRGSRAMKRLFESGGTARDATTRRRAVSRRASPTSISGDSPMDAVRLILRTFGIHPLRAGSVRTYPSAFGDPLEHHAHKPSRRRRIRDALARRFGFR